MNILVCIKRVPAPGRNISLSEDNREIITRNLGFTISPHEECAIEEALRIKEKCGGSVTVLTLGSEDAVEQLRYAMAQGADDAILLQTDGREWDPMATARAIVAAIADKQFDLLLFGNESADSGGYQVGCRIAHALDFPFLSGVKSLRVEAGKISARRDNPGGSEIYAIDLPAAISVKEGINLPRYPSLPGRMRARRKPIEISKPTQLSGGPEMIRLIVPEGEESKVEILGNDIRAVPKVIEVLQQLKITKMKL